MLRRCRRALAAASATAVVKSSLLPLEALTQIQLGITPALSVQRGFLLEHCQPQLQQRGITEAKLLAMDGKLSAQLMKRVVLEQYLAVPFRVYSFDMEFTGPPVFTADGPTEDITEFGLYSPARNATFSCLVRPTCGRLQGPGVAELTHITDEELAKDGLPFPEAWARFVEFVNTPEPDEMPGAEKRILLLSHGGKLADVSLIKWTLERCHLQLPPSFVFGDTIHLIRDAHRRRPVTVDKHPPSWKLLDLVQWLKIPPTLPAHRAGNDAVMTWDALYHTLLRYGDDELSPREQLVPRFFDEEAKARMRAGQAERQRLHQQSSDGLNDTDLLDASVATAGGGASLASRSSGLGLSHAFLRSGSAAVGAGAVDTLTSTDTLSTDVDTDALSLDFDEVFSSQGTTPSTAEVAVSNTVEKDDDGNADPTAPSPSYTAETISGASSPEEDATAQSGLAPVAVAPSKVLTDKQTSPRRVSARETKTQKGRRAPKRTTAAKPKETDLVQFEV